MPDLYIIAECNGAGKTTASYTILPEMLNCREFVNADTIATGLSAFNPEAVRRYYRGLSNLFKLFMPLCDYWLLIDNSDTMQAIAEGERNFVKEIKNHELWNTINKQYAG